MSGWKPDICVYHGGCDDGFGAAWVVRKKWPDVQFVPGAYSASSQFAPSSTEVREASDGTACQ